MKKRISSTFANTHSKSVRDALNSLKKTRSSSRKSRKDYLRTESTNPPFRAYGDKNAIDRITKTVEILAKSETGLSLLEKAHKEGYTILLEKLGDAFGYCDFNKKFIVLNSAVSDNQNVGTLAHEAVHTEQFAKNIGLSSNLDIKSYIMEARVMEADAETRAGFSLLELKEKGIEEPWKHFKNDSPTVARAMEKSLKENDLNKKEGQKNILTSGFKGWYDFEQVKNAYDKDYVDIIKDAIDNNEKMRFNKKHNPKKLIESCCIFNDNSLYFNDNPEILLEPKYLGIRQSTMNALKKLMKEREEKQKLPADNSLDEIPVTKSTYSKGSKKVSKNSKVPVQYFLSKITQK